MNIKIWEESDSYDNKRESFREILKTYDYEDKSNPFYVVCVWFDEENESGIEWII